MVAAVALLFVRPSLRVLAKARIWDLAKFNLANDWQAQGYTFDTALGLLSVTAGIGGLIGGLLISTWRASRSAAFTAYSSLCC